MNATAVEGISPSQSEPSDRARGVLPPLLQTYLETQAIRLYYEFGYLNVDRYHPADGFHQVVPSPREPAAQLPADAQKTIDALKQLLANRAQ